MILRYLYCLFNRSLLQPTHFFYRLFNSAKQSKKIRFFFWGILSLIFLFFVLNLIFPVNATIEYSQTVLDKNGQVLQSYLTYDDKWRLYTELDEISPNIKKAIINKEDKYFYYHPGINIIAVGRSLVNNIFYHKRTSGASTITMQVARMLAPKRRTYVSKVIEMFRALQLEWKFSKDEILQLYLNKVPYGGNIEGVKSASLFYFQKNPDFLSVAEITTLAIIPNRPNSLRIGADNEYLTEERNKWLKRFEKEKVFSSVDVTDALSEKLTAKRNKSPKYAPHFCRRMIKMFPKMPLIRTNLDIKLQSEVEEITANYIRRVNQRNIRNASVFIIDNQTGNVVCYVGSSDFNNSIDGGQVDGVKAIRQPGSTLKPLIYGLAIDKGWITPKTVMTDVSINFDGYRPENFDRKFNGYVTAEQALSNSLNIPAVKLLARLTPDTLVKHLIEMNFKQVQKDEKHLGLSIALGGCGVRLEELTNMYAAFAREGKWQSIRWIKSNEPIFQFSILSPAATFMITDILVQKERPDMPTAYENTYHLPKIAWKTGTSYGRRDAWSIGYNKRFTVGVWCGNFDGEGVPELSGAEIATPLLFDIFNTIDYNSTNDWYQAPKEVAFRYVCNESGKRPNSYCVNQVIDYYIPMISDNTVCTHLKEIYVSANDSFSYCNACLPTFGYKKMTVKNNPPEMIDYFEQHHINYEKIPPHCPSCEKLFVYGAPEITSPANNMSYMLDKKETNQLMLACNASNDVKKVFWYINNQFYKAAERNEKLFIQPEEGKLKISCSDDKGRNADVWVTVKYINM